ncbi:MAG: hypothetical protein J6P57_07505 [Lachnospiraceae bacterium]|nr:hypothetical protein [Lachnospiraceae bacterium]
MLNVYYCPCCERFRFIQYEVNIECRACYTEMYKVKLSFIQFTKLSLEERYEHFIPDYIESDYYNKIFEDKRKREEIVKKRMRRLGKPRKKRKNRYEED